MRKARLFSLFGVGVLVAALICMIGIPGGQANLAPSIKILYPFRIHKGNFPQGAYPYGSLTLSGTTLFGTTTSGGAKNLGTLFKLNTASHVQTVLHSFGKAQYDGYQPHGSLTLSGTTLYGMTYLGGDNGGGTIFKFDTARQVYTVLHSFAGSPNDGAGPFYGSLTLSGTILYGMTSAGGANGLGTIFMFDTATGDETVLYSFAGGLTDGSGPAGSLTLSASGTTLYGMTPSGGFFNAGTIFMFDTVAKAETVLYSFAGGLTDGANPVGSLILSGTTLYGMTSAGGSAKSLGVIFTFDTAAMVETVLHSFAGGSDDGSNPVGDLTLSGTTLYGMTYQGGANLGGAPFNGLGTIFMFDTVGMVQTVLHSFAGGTKDGDYPTGSLILSGTTLYGMTPTAGANNLGTIFSAPSAVPPTISGTVTSSAGSSPMPGVTVTLSQTGWTSKTTTDQSGAYSFSDLAPGSYTVAASFPAFAFTPNRPSVSVTGTDVTQNFTGAPVTISGTVTRPTPVTTTDLIMKLTGKATGTYTLDASGNYQFSTLANGTYKVTPTITSTHPTPVPAATPPSASIVINGKSVTQNFTYKTNTCSAVGCHQ